MLDKLRKPFPAAQVKKNQDGLDYVAIDGYINRLLDSLGLDYETEFVHLNYELLPEQMKTSSGKRQWAASVALHLVIDGKRRLGVGGDVSFDLDKALKTALAEALKKACHQFGIALELWDAEHRKELETVRKAAGGSEAALKTAVWNLAKQRLGKETPTVAEVAEEFGVKPAELKTKETLQKILTTAGVI